MSYETWNFYGRGFNFSEFEVNCEKAGMPITVEDMERLLTVAPMLAKEIHDDMQPFKEAYKEWNPDIQAYKDWKPTLEFYEDWDQTHFYGIATIFAFAVAEAEDMAHICAVDNFDCERFVLFLQDYPWNMNEKEKSMTEESIDAVLEKYLEILKPDAPPIWIDDMSVENGG